MNFLSHPAAASSLKLFGRKAHHFLSPKILTNSGFAGSNGMIRSRHTFALTRAVSDSFAVNSISKYAANNDEDPINVSLATSQHDHYVSVLRTILPTLELPPLEAYPDSVFVEDTVVAHKKRAVITCIGHTSRQGEVDSIQQVLNEQLGMDVWDMRNIDSSAKLDGGDVLTTGRHMFVGLSDRTNLAGVNVLRQAFESDSDDGLIVIPVHLDSKDALHLKSIVTHLDETTLMVPQGNIGDKVVQEIKAEELGYKLLVLPDIRACNVVTVNNRMVVVSESICDESKRILQEATKERGMDLELVGTSEIMKSDGAVTCCSVLLSL